MHFFSHLKINGCLLEGKGYFQSKKNILEIHCNEVLSLSRNWKYEEVLVEELALLNQDEMIYFNRSPLVIAEVSHNQIQLLHI